MISTLMNCYLNFSFVQLTAQTYVMAGLPLPSNTSERKNHVS